MRFIGAAAVLGLCAITAPASAQKFSMSSPPSPDDRADPQIIAGTEVINPSDWPATFVFRGQESRPCTATVVGPRAVLTAAHCVADGGQGDLVIGRGRFHLTCRRHGNFFKPPEYDVALCLASEDIRLRQRTDRFERVHDGAEIDLSSRKVQHLGFGCTSQGGADFGILYRGDATVSVTPTPTAPRIETRDGARVCAGDSGGAAYLQVGGERVVVGVQSTGAATFTQMAALTDRDTVALLVRATQPNSQGTPQKVRICGLDDTLSNCR